jgi:hypothetical protein
VFAEHSAEARVHGYPNPIPAVPNYVPRGALLQMFTLEFILGGHCPDAQAR